MSKISMSKRLVAMSALGAALVLGGGSAFAQTNGSGTDNGSGTEGGTSTDNGSGNGSGTGGGTDTGGDVTAAPPADGGTVGSSLPDTGGEALVTLGAAGVLVTLAGAARRAALRS